MKEYGINDSWYKEVAMAQSLIPDGRLGFLKLSNFGAQRVHAFNRPDLVSESDSEDEDEDEDEDETVNLERPGVLDCLEIKGELDTSHLHHALVTSLDLNATPIFKNSKILKVGTVNGLVCLWQYRDEVVNSLFYRGNPLYPEKEVVKSYVCNPITREYVILPRPQYVGSIPV
ncbi:hypothetical protein Tco_0057062, partial [Tanacetum coccineum]